MQFHTTVKLHVTVLGVLYHGSHTDQRRRQVNELYVEEPWISGGVSINHRNHGLKQLALGREDPEKATSSDR